MILDTSVAVKWFLLDEQNREEAKILLQRHQEEKDTIIIPHLLFLEIVNTFTTKRAIPQKVGEELIIRLYDLKLQIYYPTQEDIIETFRLAKKYHTTVYDMLYAVIAKKLKTILVTADKKFVESIKFSYVKFLADLPSK